MNEPQARAARDWSLRALVFVTAVLVIVVVVMTIQVQRRNNNIAKIDHATAEIQTIVNEFKTAATAQQSNSVDSQAVAHGLVTIEQIYAKIEALEEDLAND
jgi:cytochrome oxidase assembly protein ShyY1